MRTHFPVASHHGGIIQTSNCFLEKLLREETLSPEPQAEFYKQVLWDGGSREFPITLQASFLAPLSPHTEPHLEVIHRQELASQAVRAQQRHSAGADNSPRWALPQEAAATTGRVYPGVCASAGLGAGRAPCPLLSCERRREAGMCLGSPLLGLLAQSILEPCFRL